jgi:hypothetical protein
MSSSLSDLLQGTLGILILAGASLSESDDSSWRRWLGDLSWHALTAFLFVQILV